MPCRVSHVPPWPAQVELDAGVDLDLLPYIPCSLALDSIKRHHLAVDAVFNPRLTTGNHGGLARWP